MGHTERVRPGIEDTERFFLQSFVIPSFSSFPIPSDVFPIFFHKTLRDKNPERNLTKEIPF